ncbi:cytochrome P460 [Chitinophaga agrisoli]|uniref:Cytochrome P460 n=1 Tax=Chitinophaga agrisoli TaxID=2607653 RepID=A0A5B2VSX7_9BACT|nr:heme-binding domain-containing protein [Chitinophaga agrisoli]KAA2241914.1 cytochrome P460 [Chitinophaga agrisoli]
MNALPRKRPSKRGLLILGLLLLCFICMQFIRPELPRQPVTGDLQAPAEVKTLLQRACYDCHSNQTQLRWYDQLAPAYWRVAEHIKDGRKALNFSNWDSLTTVQQKGKLFECFSQIENGAMPLSDYAFVHREARLSKEDINTLKNYLGSMIHLPVADSAKLAAVNEQVQGFKGSARHISNVQPALNGIAYIPDYKNWQVVSTTDRIDNNTLRVIYGNDIAIKAIQEGHINPWPNGTIFAKVAWDQLQDADGNVHSGAFKQIEYMIKDDKKYASTGGWGWARWLTPQLKPYGKSITFSTECINCHRPMKDNDLVFTMPVKQ